MTSSRSCVLSIHTSAWKLAAYRCGKTSVADTCGLCLCATRRPQSLRGSFFQFTETSKHVRHAVVIVWPPSQSNSICSYLKLHDEGQLQQISERDGLYPLQALIQPISLRFKYHFEGTRQTNRLDKVSFRSCCQMIIIAHQECFTSQSGTSHMYSMLPTSIAHSWTVLYKVFCPRLSTVILWLG